MLENLLREQVTGVDSADMLMPTLVTTIASLDAQSPVSFRSWKIESVQLSRFNALALIPVVSMVMPETLMYLAWLIVVLVASEAGLPGVEVELTVWNAGTSAEQVMIVLSLPAPMRLA